MKKLIFLGIFLFNVTALAQTQQKEVEQLVKAYGFCLGQEHALKVFEKQYPSLYNDILVVKMSFDNSDIGRGCIGAKRLITNIASEKGLIKIQDNMVRSLSKEINYSNYTKEDALDFINEVKLRINGAMPEDILKTLLSSNKEFIDHPESEFTNGWKQTFYSKNHKKALGLDINLSVPKSWNMKEGKRPHIVQTFSRKVQEGVVTASLQIRKIKTEEHLSQEEMQEFLNVKNHIPEGANSVSSKRIVLEGFPGVKSVWDIEQERLDFKFKLRCSSYIVVYKNYMIFIQGMTMVNDDKKYNLAAFHDKYSKVYDLIANSLVINNRY